VRNQYLSQIWEKQKYPPVNGRFFSRSELSSFPHGRARMGGRVARIQNSEIWIFWEGEMIRFGLNPLLELAPGFKAEDVLKAGDLVEAIIWKDSQNSPLRLEALALLVPSQKENPFENEFGFKRAHQWDECLASIREFFKSRDFLEVRTPTLVPSPGLEPHLDPFKTQFEMGSRRQDFYLPTSPEFHLKKALAQGFPRIFEFKECFRNGELSQHHQPEFLMLEWYRAFSEMEVLIKETAALVEHLQKKFCEETQPSTIATLDALFKNEFGFTITPQTTRDELARLARELDLTIDDKDDFDSIFMRIFVEKIESSLGRHGPVILYHFPPSQAALARLTSEGWADRFELFWKGFEIANAFHELNDPEEQRRRFKIDQEKKRELGKAVVAVDEEFLAALDYGMPPSVGIALGVERLFMALMGLEVLSEARLFPVR